MSLPRPAAAEAAQPPPDCPLCPRLAALRAANRAAYPDWHNAPVPSWGPATAPLLVLGMAPGQRGANRTGRPFTGDHAGKLLYATLRKYHLAEGDYLERPDDGLRLTGCRVTNAVRCVPPANRPEPAEARACNGFLRGELAAMPQLRVVLALGTLAHDALLRALGLRLSSLRFRHGACHPLPGGLLLADSYHVSRYNTSTRRLTPEMFEAVVAEVLRRLGDLNRPAEAMMPRHPPAELLTPAEMARADAWAVAAGIPGLRLMEAAGRAVARAARQRFRPTRTLVLAGPGNNGGDGYVAARLLEQAGWPVAVAALAPPRPGSDAAAAAGRWRGPRLPFGPAEAARAGLVIDAVFGAGLARPVEGLVAATLAAVRAPLLAVDVPSGLDGGTGQPRGFAPQAALTVTFFRLKPGHLLLPGRGLCGETLLAEIGLPAAALPDLGLAAWRNGPDRWRLPAFGAAAHKYSRGHLTLLGGAAMTGATRLAAGAAHRAGAGLVTIQAPDPAAAALYRAGDPGTIVTEAPLAELLADPRRRCWLLGPGLPADAPTRARLRQLIAAGRQVVADAGALAACAGQPEALAGAAVLTPHAGEFAQVFGPIGGDKPAAARRAATQTGAVVLLKGADTVIAAADGRILINANAPPSLATAGSGDVLAGVIAALLTQGMPAFEAAGAGAWLQGEAAAAWARRGGGALLAEDLITLLATAGLAANEA